jgi:putative membrane protein
MRKTLLLSMLSLSMGISAFAQQADKVGKLSADEFKQINTQGNEMVAAITPDQSALSAADKQLMMKVAAGGQRQLALSQALLDKVSDPQVKMLAASEVEEQTGVAAKLKEIATAKGVTLPEGPDAAAQSLVSRTENLSGAAADAFYLTEGGIKGHELLQKTMTTVNGTAKDAALKGLAAATLPVIRTHLSVSKDVKSTMGKKSGTAAR